VWRVSRDPDGVILYTRPGRVGGERERCCNAHIVENGFHYNASGEGAFGGATSWPVVTAQVSLPTGMADLAEQLTRDLKKFVGEFLLRNKL